MDARRIQHLHAAVEALTALEAEVSPRPGEVRLTLDGPVAWLRLDNPGAHNAMTVRMMRQLTVAVARLLDWDGSVVALASVGGGTFCSGGHLGQVRESLVDPDAARVMSAAVGTALDALFDLPALSVAILEGPAIGGGAELAMACDLRVASPAASVHFAQVQLGVACGWGGAGRLVQRVGRSTAARVLCRAEPLGPEAAAALGLVDVIAEGGAEALLEAAVGPALRHPTEAVRAAKRQAAALDPDAEREAFLSVWGSPAHLAALGLTR